MEQQKTETRSITAEQRKRVEEVCFRSLALIGRNCEYLEQHFDRTGADASTRQAVADIDTAAMQLDRTLSEAITLLEFLHEDTKPQLYPIDLCELLQQVAAQSDMIRAQLGVDIRLDYGGCTACCVMADRRDAELLCLHLLLHLHLLQVGSTCSSHEVSSTLHAHAHTHECLCSTSGI